VLLRVVSAKLPDERKIAWGERKKEMRERCSWEKERT
jgi:hypothetical protein